MDKVNEYFAKLPPEDAKILRQIRNRISKLLPEAEDRITYGMPGFYYKKKYLIAYSAFKNHMSVFPGGTALQSLGDDIAQYKTSKGTLQFTHDNLLTEDILDRIIEHRVKEIES